MKDGIKRRRFRDIALSQRVTHITRKASRAHHRARSVAHGKEHIFERETRTAHRLDRFFNLRAELIKRCEEMRLFSLLRGVVTLPVLRVFLFDCDRLCDSLRLTIRDDLALQNNLNCEHMFAPRSAKLEVGAVAEWRFRIGIDRVGFWP